MQDLVFNLTALRGTNKTGLIKPDEHGYYEVCLGALHAFNRRGDFYPYTDRVKELFESSSSFMRRVNEGALRGEKEHPEFKPGMTHQQFLQRVSWIDPNNVSHHIRSVRLDFNGTRDKEGRKVIGVYGFVRPRGPHAEDLQTAFNNPHENVAFSIRSLTMNTPLPNGNINRSILEIATWDWVTEAGIAIADKYYSPSLESLEKYSKSEIRITPGLIESVTKTAEREGVSMENNLMDFGSIMHLMGWKRSPGARVVSW